MWVLGIKVCEVESFVELIVRDDNIWEFCMIVSLVLVRERYMFLDYSKWWFGVWKLGFEREFVGCVIWLDFLWIVSEFIGMILVNDIDDFFLLFV